MMLVHLNYGRPTVGGPMVRAAYKEPKREPLNETPVKFPAVDGTTVRADTLLFHSNTGGVESEPLVVEALGTAHRLECALSRHDDHRIVL